MEKKNIGFVYYTPFSNKNSSDIIDIEEYLQIFSNEKEHTPIMVSSGKYVNIGTVTKHNHLSVDELDLNYTLWEIHFIKSMVESPVKYDINKNELSDIDLSYDERIAEMNVLLYDPVTKIVSISKNHKGASTVNIRDFINNIIDDNDNKIDFRPVLDDRDIENLLNSIYSITFRAVSTNYAVSANYEDGDAISDVFKGINTLKADIADDVQAELTISLADNRNHSKYFGSTINTWIKRLKEYVTKGYVSKLRVTTDGVNGKKIDMIDLIENTIYDSCSFDLNVDNRYVDPHRIFKKMAYKYNMRRNHYLCE